MDRLLCPHDQARRSISLIFRMVTRFCGIVALLKENEGHNTLLSYLTTTTGGRIHSGTLVGLPAELWSVSNRNRGRFHAGTVVGFIRNLQILLRNVKSRVSPAFPFNISIPPSTRYASFPHILIHFLKYRRCTLELGGILRAPGTGQRVQIIVDDSSLLFIDPQGFLENPEHDGIDAGILLTGLDADEVEILAIYRLFPGCRTLPGKLRKRQGRTSGDLSYIIRYPGGPTVAHDAVEQSHEARGRLRQAVLHRPSDHLLLRNGMVADGSARGPADEPRHLGVIERLRAGQVVFAALVRAGKGLGGNGGDVLRGDEAGPGVRGGQEYLSSTDHGGQEAGGEVLHEEVGAHNGVVEPRCHQVPFDPAQRRILVGIHTQGRVEDDLSYAERLGQVDDRVQLGGRIHIQRRRDQQQAVHPLQRRLVGAWVRIVEPYVVHCGGTGGLRAPGSGPDVETTGGEGGNGRLSQTAAGPGYKNSFHLFAPFVLPVCGVRYIYRPIRFVAEPIVEKILYLQVVLDHQ